MINSNKYRLDSICKLVTDGTHDSPKNLIEGFPFIKGTQIKEGRINFNNCDYISKEDHLKVIKRSKSEKGDILFSNIGVNLGETAIVNVDFEFSIKNVALFKPNKDLVDNRFLYYLISSPREQALLKNKRNGAAQPFLDLKTLRGHILNIPKLEIQKKIASILSAYDDLIENNNQRITLLEGIASEIYKEWFVRFRFPGYQNSRFLDKDGNEVESGIKGAIPEGWKNETIGSLYKVSSGFAFKGSELGEVGVPIIKIRNINNLEVDLINCNRFSGEINQRVEKFLLKSKDLLIAMTGATIGKVSLFPNATEKYYLNQRVGKFFPHNDALGTSYIYQFVKTRYFKETIINYGMGAAQPNISGEQIESIKIIIPEKKILNKFSSLADSMIDEMLILRSKNQILQETRDLLLPRLISGKLSVESLEVENIES